jgi:choline dehydrogenase-like flavoprotein
LDNTFDIVVVGTSFSGSFFLHNYLAKAGKNIRIQVLERGQKHSHQWQLKNRRISNISTDSTYVNRTPAKHWNYIIGFGGSSRAWWACTPRLMPNDLRLKSTYGVGRDWPISYDELEPYYTAAEIIMSVSGPNDAPYPRSQPCPQPPHRFNNPDKLLKQAYPDLYFQQATARVRQATKNRTLCCNNGVCGLCPIDVKFTIQNELEHLYSDPRINLLLGAEALAVETTGGNATGVRYLHEGVEKVVKADLVVLGTNAIFNPYLLQRSNITHPLLGKRLNEQISMWAKIDLNGVDSFQGSTSISANGYMLYDGPHRSDYSACLMEIHNVPNLRTERGRWRQRTNMKLIFEDLPDEKNYVTVNKADSSKPETVHQGFSAYTMKAIDKLPELLSKALTPLPIENMTISGPSRGESHILGTVVMGDDPETSIVDKHLVHHQIRNLLVLGGSAFPSCSPSNPTLTISALALWAAAHLS